MMKTLYDLLGALPHDDAEELRTAFRRAVKGAHPDLRPGDPDAALRFREIVRANEILADAEQREAYDHLLELARLEQAPASKQAPASRIHKLASAVMAFSGISAVTVGGYLLFMHVSSASVASANNVDVDMHAASKIAAVDFDWAFHQNVLPTDIPNVLPTYIEPAAMFYRLKKSDGVFAGTAPAKRPRSKPARAIARKPIEKPIDQFAFGPSVTPPSYRWRTAAQDPSRGESIPEMQ
jgi:curved DNA-binding protein CbpA